jgi:3-dehydroquinate synthase
VTGHRRIDLALPDGRTSAIVIGPGAWEEIPRHLALRPPSAAALVADETVFAAHGGRLLPLFALRGESPLVHLLPAGEESKSFAELERICRRLAAAGFARDSLVAAVGGGVAGDLAGAAASFYLRGVRLVQVPTSLLAMVDSSVGGKNAVNLPEGKNLAGTIHQPEAVFADTRALSTLPAAEWYSGMAEVVKAALTLDPALLAQLEGRGIAPPAGPGSDPSPMIESCCRSKAEVVSADERERGWRRVLNFGHTMAHALEAFYGYGRLRHGEAVVEGMKAALVLSRDVAGLDAVEFARAARLLRGFPPPALSPEDGDLLPYLQRDKKSEKGILTVVLLSALGRVEFVPLDDPGSLVSAWRRWGDLAGD